MPSPKFSNSRSAAQRGRVQWKAKEEEKEKVEEAVEGRRKRNRSWGLGRRWRGHRPGVCRVTAPA